MSGKTKVGDRVQTQNCGECVVIQYVNSGEVYAEFVDTGFVVKCSAGNFRKGKVKDLLKKNVFGIGCIGVGEYKCRVTEKNSSCTKEYQTWNAMLNRCYGANRDEGTLRNYEDCYVCDDWHNFQNFAKWCQTQPEMLFKGSSLDKDILVDGNREYAPDKCCFVPTALNTAVTSAKHTNTTGAVGVWASGENFAAEITLCGKSVSIGSFDSVRKAEYMHKVVKSAYIKGLSEVYKDFISHQVYEKLQTWGLNDNTTI